MKGDCGFILEFWCRLSFNLSLKFESEPQIWIAGDANSPSLPSTPPSPPPPPAGNCKLIFWTEHIERFLQTQCQEELPRRVEGEWTGEKKEKSRFRQWPPWEGREWRAWGADLTASLPFDGTRGVKRRKRERRKEKGREVKGEDVIEGRREGIWCCSPPCCPYCSTIKQGRWFSATIELLAQRGPRKHLRPSVRAKNVQGYQISDSEQSTGKLFIGQLDQTRPDHCCYHRY